MLHFETLSDDLTKRMEQDALLGTSPKLAFDNSAVIRRRSISTDIPSIWRPAFGHDIDKILNCPFYNRYADKTQVFSLVRNDDVSRRSLHVQLVSRIARTLGSALHLNLDLIEAMALGHDIGHPPFAHSGEKALNEIYFAHMGARPALSVWKTIRPCPCGEFQTIFPGDRFPPWRILRP